MLHFKRSPSEKYGVNQHFSPPVIDNPDSILSQNREQYGKKKLGEAQLALAWGLISIGFAFLTSPGVISEFLIQIKKIRASNFESAVSILSLSTFSSCFLWAMGHTLGEGLSWTAWGREEKNLEKIGKTIWNRNLLKEFVGFLFFFQEWLVPLNSWKKLVNYSIFALADFLFRTICLIGGLAGIISFSRCFFLGASGNTYFFGLAIIQWFLTPVMLACALTSLPRYSLLFFGQEVLLVIVIFDWLSNGFSPKLLVLGAAVFFILLVAVRMVRNSIEISWFLASLKEPNLAQIWRQYLEKAARTARAMNSPKTFLRPVWHGIFR